MYLHLGQSVVVPFRDVIGVFDMDNTTSSHLTRKFLERAEREGRVVDVSGDLPKMCIRDSPQAVSAAQRKIQIVIYPVFFIFSNPN